MMLARRWAVRIFDPEYIGIVYFHTRREARAFRSLFTLPTMREKSMSAWVGRTGLE